MHASGKISFVGSFLHNLDAKGRLTVPKKWRYEGDTNDDAYMALSHPLGFLMVLPPRRADELYEQISQIKASSNKQQIMVQGLIGSAFELSCDSAGRFQLPAEAIRHCGLEREVRLVGAMVDFRIWEPRRLERFQNGEFLDGISSEQRRVLEAMEEFGI